MTKEEREEYDHLITLWNCTEPMTKEQVDRLEELTAIFMSNQNNNQ